MEVPGGWELLMCLLVALVVFGSKRLPDSARALGQSLRILKAETRGLRDDSAQVPTPVARFDVYTGQPLARFDPVTGEPLGGPPPISPSASGPVAG